MESPASIKVIAKAIISNSEGKLLVLLRGKAAPRRPLTWDLPGGLIEYGEDPVDTVRREVMEETQLKIGDLRLVSVFVPPKPPYAILIIYTARASTDEVKISWEHDEYRWVELSEFEAMDSPDGFKAAARIALKPN